MAQMLSSISACHSTMYGSLAMHHGKELASIGNLVGGKSRRRGMRGVLLPGGILVLGMKKYNFKV